MTNEGFDIPIVIMIFKRKDKIKLIMDRISKVKPKKIYILADGPRDESEAEAVWKCRKHVLESITWECEVVKHFSDVNIGVYENIGEGAKWVFEREEKAIFLEDDNLPEVSFFQYCKDLLAYYEKNERVFWVCGTNYLQDYVDGSNVSYYFTQHLLPCGWASWSDKFLKYYDGAVSKADDKQTMRKIKNLYVYKRLYKQQTSLVKMERKRILRGDKPTSWDYQMEFAIKVNNLLGVSPAKNQIQNIGVDEDSIHGGSNLNNIMTRRFCLIKSYSLDFPLIHPKEVKIDITFERKLGKIILYPLSLEVKRKIGKFLKKIFNIGENESIKKKLVFWK